jgi:hemerythrin-like metal-binding protein
VQPIIWDERLSTGDPHIDAQHAELHDLVLELGLLMEEDSNRVALGEVLFDVLAYASTHFADEEALMERIGFPGLARQKALHAEFRRVVTVMAERFAAGDETLTAEQVQEQLHEWLVNHVWEEDLQFAVYIRPQGN